MSKSWYKMGDEGIEFANREDVERQKRSEASRDPRSNRFWLEKDSSAKVTFLDTPKFFLLEHNQKIDGKWGNFETCIKELEECPLDLAGYIPSCIVVCTIISHKVWRDRDGKSHTNQKQLLVAKGVARQRLVKQISKRDGDLRGCVFELERGNARNECNTGEVFEFIGRLTENKLKKFVPKDQDPNEFLAPFNYAKIFAPKTAEELRELVGASAPVGSEYRTVSDEKELMKNDSEKDDDVIASIDDLMEL